MGLDEGKCYITLTCGTDPPVDLDLGAYAKANISFGRSQENDIVISSAITSNFHGQFYIDQNLIYVKDQASTNGIYVNGKKILGMTLLTGDELITFESPAAKDLTTADEARAYGVSMYLTIGEIGKREHIALDGKPVRIGRSENSEVRLNRVGVSLSHARITFLNESYYIEDTSSENGTYLNNQRLTKQTKLELRDVIGICGMRLVYTGTQLYYTSHPPRVGILCQGLSRSVKDGSGTKKILDNVNLSVRAGELVYIIGGSGAGKSTLLNVMSGLSTSEGRVFLNGVDLKRHYGQLKNLIGYVPQKDIVYTKLKLFDMLYYEAKLRLPSDYSKEEYEKRVRVCISMVELEGHEQTLVSRLSGGQLKRASIAVELLSDPVLLYMDEPSSGLDPGTEKSLMGTLKKMASAGKTILVITHATLNVAFADQLVVMGTGGRLCYYGDVPGASAFFGVDAFADIYNKIGNESVKWQAKYDASIVPVAATEIDDTPEDLSSTSRRAHGFKQLSVLISRYTKLLLSAKLVGFMAQAPLIGALLVMVSQKWDMYGQLITFSYATTTKSLLFALACGGFWIGILNAITEVTSEADLFRRERMAGLKVSAYVESKVIVQSLICLAQTSVIYFIVWLCVGFPEGSESLSISPALGIFITLYLVSLSAMCLGLAISSLSPSTDIAMSAAPVVLMGQILFSGIAFELTGFAQRFSMIFSCKWGVRAFLTLASINTMKADSDASQASFLSVEFEAINSNLYKSWGILLLMSVLAALLSVVSLKLKKQKI
jgi:ABC-type multidrug transport system ATPase subunit/pSer/pThr/pTyr-binding forkhead associated (FHA) protein